MLMRTTTSKPMLTRTNNLRSNPILKHLLKCINYSTTCIRLNNDISAKYSDSASNFSRLNVPIFRL